MERESATMAADERYVEEKLERDPVLVGRISSDLFVRAISVCVWRGLPAEMILPRDGTNDATPERALVEPSGHVALRAMDACMRSIYLSAWPARNVATGKAGAARWEIVRTSERQDRAAIGREPNLEVCLFGLDAVSVLSGFRSDGETASAERFSSAAYAARQLVKGGLDASLFFPQGDGNVSAADVERAVRCTYDAESATLFAGAGRTAVPTPETAEGCCVLY